MLERESDQVLLIEFKMHTKNFQLILHLLAPSTISLSCGYDSLPQCIQSLSIVDLIVGYSSFGAWIPNWLSDKTYSYSTTTQQPKGGVQGHHLGLLEILRID